MTLPDAELKLFTLAEAQKTLPLVRVIVRDVQAAFAELRERAERLNRMAGRAGVRPAKEDLRARGSLEEDIERLRRRIEAAADELADLGAELKDFELGLVDFPSRMGDQVVYLCWRAGEDRIRFWHTLEGGFAARQPIGGEA